jgi:hypothetical protein
VIQRGILVKFPDFPWNNRIIFVLRIWWTESTCPWTMWGVVHGGPASMAGTDLDWKREETWAEMCKPNRNKYLEYLAADLTEFK